MINFNPVKTNFGNFNVQNFRNNNCVAIKNNSGADSFVAQKTSHKNVAFTGYFPDACNLKPAHEIANLIKSYKNKHIILLAHHCPDGDAIGSMLSLKHIIQKATGNKNVEALSLRAIPHNLSFIDAKSEIKNVSKEFHSSSHYDEKFLAQLREKYGNADLVITTDVSCKKMLDQPFLTEVFDTAKKIVKIDHHPEVENFGDIDWVDESKESASQLVMQLVRPLGLKVKNVEKNISDPISLGLLSDSDCFSFPNNKEIFNDAAKLSKTSNIRKITKDMKAMNPNEFKMYIGLLSSVEFSPDKTVAYCIADRVKYPDVTKEIIGSVLSKISDIKGVKYYFCVNGNPYKLNTTVTASIRSNSGDILESVKKIGGNGHKLACGLKKDNTSVDEAKNIILSSLQNLSNQ